MTVRKELCRLIYEHCEEGYHKHKPTKTHSYKTLAKAANLPVTTLQNWMNQDSIPTLDRAQQVLAAMGYELCIVRRVENGR